MALNGQTLRGSIVGIRLDLEEALAFAAEGKVMATIEDRRWRRSTISFIV
jgi:alcohol dehydrogenase, propanol-preferring